MSNANPSPAHVIFSKWLLDLKWSVLKIRSTHLELRWIKIWSCITQFLCINPNLKSGTMWFLMCHFVCFANPYCWVKMFSFQYITYTEYTHAITHTLKWKNIHVRPCVRHIPCGQRVVFELISHFSSIFSLGMSVAAGLPSLSLSVSLPRSIPLSLTSVYSSNSACLNDCLRAWNWSLHYFSIPLVPGMYG